MSDLLKYQDAIRAIKDAILISQYESVVSINEKELQLYFSVGHYISDNSRKGKWGQDALSTISIQLQKELPGLRGFSQRNLRNMRVFYEQWRDALLIGVKNENKLNLAGAPAEITKSNFKDEHFIKSFLSIGFTHHCTILSNVKSLEERVYYIKKCADFHLSYRQLEELIKADDYHHRGKLVSNFETTIKDGRSASKALEAFTDQILLPAIVVEELNSRDINDVDEKVLENAIVHNIKKFILTMGNGFSFISNQFHIEAFGEDEYIDLLFFNRDLNCLVAIELKTGKFKSSYLGQLSGYLTLLNKFERKQHENPAIGIVLCKEANKAVVDLLIQDYNNPMGVSTYKTSEEMPEKLKKALPNIDDLRKLLESPDIEKL